MTTEIDSEAKAAYVRFKKAKVAKTVSEDKGGIIIAADLDASGEVIGVEIIGLAR